MDLINETDKSAGTYYEIAQTANLLNIGFQYKLIAGVDNTIELQFWGTMYIGADHNTDDDWVNITSFFTNSAQVSVSNDSVHDMALVDTNCTFAKIKVKYIITAQSPDNTIKVGWNSDKL